ncbi:hypothetical protein IQ07DRAFT_115755 [Pyrenochaeta sp. DS3sAY3a]|nr:hypothetical protein IQ07DRAFT_115755 [Pyrenochaeta sp. DS3sAY3a]
MDAARVKRRIIFFIMNIMVLSTKFNTGLSLSTVCEFSTPHLDPTSLNTPKHETTNNKFPYDAGHPHTTTRSFQHLFQRISTFTRPPSPRPTSAQRHFIYPSQPKVPTRKDPSSTDQAPFIAHSRVVSRQGPYLCQDPGCHGSNVLDGFPLETRHPRVLCAYALTSFVCKPVR